MTQGCDQSEIEELKENFKKQLECAFFNIGIVVGEQIKTIVDAEIANHKKSIENLQSILMILPNLQTSCSKIPQSSGESTDQQTGN